MSKTEERRVLVARLVAEGHTSSGSVATALKEKGIDVHRSTVARDMELLQGTENTQVQRHEDRVRDLTEMLNEKDVSRREKIALHRTLNETEGKLRALQAMEKEAEEPGQSEEARHEWNAVKFKILKKNAEEYDAKRRQEIRQEIYAELREKGIEIEV